MSRRPLLHPVGRLAKAQSRMAPGGLLWSESPIPRRYSPPQVRQAGADPADGGGGVDPEMPFVVLRPVLLEPHNRGLDSETPTLTLVGGAGDATLSDDSDATYARMAYTYPSQYLGTVLATFETPALDFEPSRVELGIRVRALSNPGGQWVHWSVGLGVAPDSESWGEYYGSGTYHDSWVPPGDWEDGVFVWGNGTHGSSRVPTAAEVAVGVQIVLDNAGFPNPTQSCQLDVADVALGLTLWPEP